MTTNASSRQSLARRVALLATVMLAVGLALVSTAIALVAESKTRDRVIQVTGEKVQSIADAIDAFDATAMMLADRAYKPFRKSLPTCSSWTPSRATSRAGACCSTATRPRWMPSV